MIAFYAGQVSKQTSLDFFAMFFVDSSGERRLCPVA